MKRSWLDRDIGYDLKQAGKKKKIELHMINIHCKNFITAFFKKCNFFQIQNLTDHTIVYTQTDWHLFSLKKFWGVHLRSKNFLKPQ